MSTQPTDAELDSIDMDAKAIANQNPIGTPLAWRKAYLTALARTVLARFGQPATGGAPVAWLNPWRADQVTTDYDAYGEHGIPLYTAPQPVEREPLTDERVKEIVRGAGYDQCGIPDTERAAFINGLRHGEHAHGIGGTP